MRRAAALLCALLLAGLCGCTVLPRRSAGLESLLVVQVLGADRGGEGLILSMATAADSAKGDGPVRLSGDGSGMHDASVNVGSLVTDEELLLAHTAYILVGEQSAREGTDELLRYVFRSPELRTDAKLYIVRGGSAKDAVLLSGDGRVGASELLSAMSEGSSPRAGTLYSVAEIASGLSRNGCALAAAISLEPSSETSEDGELLTLTRAGTAVLKDGELVGFIEQEDLCALGCLLGEEGRYELEVPDAAGKSVAVELSPPRTRLVPIRGEDGRLEGAEISIELGASVAETRARTDMSREDYARALSASLESELLRRCERVLRLRRELGADFLRISERVAAASTARARAADAASPTGAVSLPITVSVSVSIDYTGDMRDGR